MGEASASELNPEPIQGFKGRCVGGAVRCWSVPGLFKQSPEPRTAKAIILFYIILFYKITIILVHYSTTSTFSNLNVTGLNPSVQHEIEGISRPS